jgi:LPXTG-motif cell wall-anchored protein
MVARLPLGPGTFVDGTSIAYPILVRREQPREGTVYRIQATLHYGSRVARLDTKVRFGHASAQRQAEFGGPAVASQGTPSWILAVAGVAALIALGALLFWWRRRRALGERGATSALARAIETAQQSGDPLSIIGVVCGADGPSARSLATLVHRHVRRGDRVLRLRETGVLAIAANTSVATASVMAAEIERQTASADTPGASVNVVAWDGEDAAALLAQATGSEPPAPAGESDTTVRSEHEGGGLEVDQAVIRLPKDDRDRDRL